MTFIEQEKEARAYNKAFLHGRKGGLRDGKKIIINAVLGLIDGSQTYKMASGEEDTYIDKRVLREAVEALREEGE